VVFWVGLGLLPIYLASKREPETVWFWWLAAFLIGPLAGVAYLLARHGERSAARYNYVPRHAADGPAVPGA
jgi:hypothetical protein